MEQRLFLKVINGQAVDHPFVENNLKQIIPNFDGDNPPEPFVSFTRIQRPTNLTPYQEVTGSHYDIVNGEWCDVWDIRDFTEEEKQNKINEIKSYGSPFPSWIWNDDLCCYQAPLPVPDENHEYTWSEDIVNWIEVVR